VNFTRSYVALGRPSWSHPDYKAAVSSGLLLHLVWTADRKEGWRVDQTQQQMADLTGLTRKEVRGLLAKFDSCGLIRIVSETYRNLPRNTIYLNLEHPFLQFLEQGNRGQETGQDVGQEQGQERERLNRGFAGIPEQEQGQETGQETGQSNNKSNNQTNDQTNNKRRTVPVSAVEVEKIAARLNARRHEHGLGDLSLSESSTKNLRSALRKHGFDACWIVVDYYCSWATKNLTLESCYRPTLFAEKLQNAIDSQNQKRVTRTAQPRPQRTDIDSLFAEVENETRNTRVPSDAENYPQVAAVGVSEPPDRRGSAPELEGSALRSAA
jgi:hypothetical protein